MKPNTILFSFLFLAALGTGAFGQFVLVDDFSDGDTTANPEWVPPATTPSPLSVLANPATGAGEVLAVTGVSGPQGINLPLPASGTGTTTLYFEFYVASGATSDVDLGIGLTDRDTGVGFGDFAGLFVPKNLGGTGPTVFDGTGTVIDNGASIVTDTWYGAWMVLDDSSNTWTLHLATTNAGRTQVTHSSGAVSSFAFRRNNGANALDRLLMVYGGAHNNDIIYFDNIHVDPNGDNPVVPNLSQTNLMIITDTDSDLLDDDLERFYTGQVGSENLTDLTTPWDGSSSGSGSGDFDGDGLSDSEEMNTTGTNPVNADTDGDGYDDGVETKTGVFFDSSDTGTDPLNPDTDNDKLLDGWENPDVGSAVPGSPGPADPYWSSPHEWDTDGDQFSDGSEALNGTDPDGAGAPVQVAGFQLLENFEGAGMTVGETYNGVNCWVADNALHLVADEPVAGGDKVGSIDGSGGLISAYTSLDYRTAPLSILDGNTGTIFIQFYADASIDLGLGLTDVIAPVGSPWTLFEPLAVFKNLVEPYQILGRNPDAAEAEQSDLLVENTWYDFWIVADNAADTYEMWIQPAGGVKTQLSWDDGGTPNTQFVFRNGTSEPLVNVLAALSAGASGTVFVDNLFVDPVSANTNLPPGVVSKPVNVGPSDLRITSVLLNGSGDLLITFTPGGSGYSLTSSPDLLTPFGPAVGATYDNVETFTVPSSFIDANPNFFFQVEEDAP